MATVDLSGNIGGISHYGRGAYGRGPYSRIRAFQPIFAGDFQIVGQQFFAGDLAPVVTFAADLGLVHDLAGDLAPSVTFAADLALIIDLAGDLSPKVTLGASLTGDWELGALDGSFGFTVVLGASGLISGPLWEASTPCPPSMWTSEEPCDVDWQPSELCNG